MSFESGDFEGWLDRGLGGALNVRSGPSPLATQAAYHAAHISGGAGLSLGSSVVSALSSKVAIGAATASLIVGGGTAVAATAATGSANPSNWGQFISQTVVPACKDKAASEDRHGIGACVSSVARLHGEMVSSADRHHGATENHENHGKASEARHNGAKGQPGKPAGEAAEGGAGGHGGGAESAHASQGQVHGGGSGH